MPRPKLKKPNTNNGRASGQTQISISLPTRLLNKIDPAAKKLYRNRSNFIVYILEQKLG